MKLILASASPRRKELLELIGVDFEVLISTTVEKKWDGKASPSHYAMNMAREKARDVVSGIAEGIVIGADTIVVFHGEVLGKPESREEAFKMLRTLSGNTHRVITGIHVEDVESGKSETGFEITNVIFDNISEEEIYRYIDTNEPMDKAGAYGIQGIGGKFIRSVEGCYFNVVGLPLNSLKRSLGSIGVEI